jgi:protein-disulfide isomerase
LGPQALNEGGLLRGHGPKVTDWFLEPTCPHCARAFEKLPLLLDAAGEDRLTVRVTIHSQPWHLFSGVVSRAILSATLLPDDPQAAWRVMAAVFANREAFVATDHCRGTNMALSLENILERIVEVSSVDFRDAFVRPEALALLKRHARFARQNSIHASPTVMVDGMVDDTIGSRDEVEEWLLKMGLSNHRRQS